MFILFYPIEYIEKLNEVDSISFHFEVGDTINLINSIKNIKANRIKPPNCNR